MEKRVVPVSGGDVAPPVSPETLSLWGAYLRSLETQPLLTKSVTSAVLSGVSDALSQYLDKGDGKGKPKKFNWKSFFNQIAIGAAFRGPLVHYWYAVLDHLFREWDPNALSTAVAKVVVDQTTFSPVFNYLYFWLIGTMEGQSSRRIQKKISASFVPLMMANVRVWSVVNLVSFKAVPPHLRVLFGNLVGVLWTAYAISISK